MGLTLHIDAQRWRRHVQNFVANAAAAGDVAVIPVTKGNGYGFGNTVLAAEAAPLSVPTLAVGTYEEVADVRGPFAGDVLVMTPWSSQRSEPPVDLDDDRVVHTVSRVDDLQELARRDTAPRVVVELLTSMRRHGVEVGQLADVAPLLDRVRFEGIALHLPLVGNRAGEARMLADQAFASLPTAEGRPALWVSHLNAAEAAAMGTALSTQVRLRVATALWLGDRGALAARANVLDAQPVRRGRRFGYRQRRAKRDGTILVVAGGTANGIGLEAPTLATTVRQRATGLAKGGLESAGRALSPFHVAGKQRWFAEPPHMQCSMIWLPHDVKPPAIGDEIAVNVRFTTTTFDHITWA